MFNICRIRIVDHAKWHRLPAVDTARLFVDAGGLMSYGIETWSLWHGAAKYVDKTLKGAKPAALSVEQPTRFELILNLKTAQAYGLTIPPMHLIQADEVIQ
jgi:putative tryptophan/tyrosine transport system substrate-binding protein